MGVEAGTGALVGTLIFVGTSILVGAFLSLYVKQKTKDSSMKSDNAK